MSRRGQWADGAGVAGAAFAALCCAGTPLIVGALGAVSLAAGVVIVHGFPARQMIWAGAAALVAATVWNVRARVSTAGP